ncbi:UNVERIFIED_CONTAM: hypothetical protein GTU68_042760, partial [Idotea baltica]|nr:hypothetical protein [Idotea baltica]
MGDTPAQCLYEDIVGTWVFSESARSFDASVTCDELGDIVYSKVFDLSFPNVAVDELGNAGTWTIIYNQGFEVNVNERSYYAFSAYEGTFANSTSFCDQTLNGWSRDKTVRNWSCFRGIKTTAVTPRVVQKIPGNLSQKKFVNDGSLIKAINSVQKSWTAKAYDEFEQYTIEEMLFRAGGPGSIVLDPPSPAPVTEELSARIATLPVNLDWRNVSGENYLSPVRDQQSCGSCYAFASMAGLESRIRISTKNQRQDVFSPQDIVDCSILSQGCIGGFNYLIAGRYAQDQGVVAEECNPYQGVDIFGGCGTDTSCSRTYVSEYSYVGGYYGACNEELMLEALVTGGPFPVSYMVYDDFYNYESGVYIHTQLKSEFNPLV